MGVGIVAIAIAINVISGAIDHQKLVSQFAKANGKLVVESNATYDSNVVTYLEKERPGESCAATTIGHDDAWIYAISSCVHSHQDEGYVNKYELIGKFGYDSNINNIISKQLMNDGGSPTIQQLFPYDIYQQYQKMDREKTTTNLNDTAITREASKK